MLLNSFQYLNKVNYTMDTYQNIHALRGDSTSPTGSFKKDLDQCLRLTAGAGLDHKTASYNSAGNPNYAYCSYKKPGHEQHEGYGEGYEDAGYGDYR